MEQGFGKGQRGFLLPKGLCTKYVTPFPSVGFITGPRVVASPETKGGGGPCSSDSRLSAYNLALMAFPRKRWFGRGKGFPSVEGEDRQAIQMP